MGVCAVVFFVMPSVLVRIFSDDPEVLEMGIKLLYVAAVFQILDAVLMVANGALNGAGDTRFTMLVSIAGSWGLMLPGGYFFGHTLGYGAPGAWMGMLIEITVVGALMSWRFWRLAHVDKARRLIPAVV